jgi:manganese/iron transport system ATP-binding protein
MIHHSDCALEIAGLAVVYDGTHVLEGIDIHVPHGHALALVGPNGAGKSTLLRSILGLTPASGSVQVLGTDPVSARPHVAYVPQAESLDPEFPISAAQVVLTGRYRRLGWFRRPGRSDRAAAAAALERVGLADRGDNRFGVLSGGQRQRVLLARAIAAQARLLLLDEPFNGVDTTTQQLLVDVLADLRREGTAVVMSTHDLSMAHLTCTEACLLNRTQIGFGPVSEVLTHEHLRQAYGPAAHAVAGSTVALA